MKLTTGGIAACILMLASVGCAQTGTDVELVEEQVEKTAAVAAFDAWEASLNPESDLAWAVEVARDRWYDATGIYLRIGADGFIPVTFSAEPECAAEAQCLGTTHLRTRTSTKVTRAFDVEVDENVKDPCALLNVITHELGHVIAPRASESHLDEAHHLMSAAFDDSEVNGCLPLDSASVAKICEVANCLWFAPEVQ